jgi:sirohydrochlorin cobaltochelatase
VSALLLVGHGTVDPEGIAGFHALTELVRSSVGADVEGGFLELASPPIQDAVARLVDLGHREIDVVPLVLVAAGHSKGDIPAALERERQRHPGTAFRYGRPLGPHPLLLADLTERLGSVVSEQAWPDTAVVLVGRGATDPDANAEVAKVSRLLLEGRGIATVETSFVSLAEPAVPAGLERADRLGYKRIVVLPYFLFDGVLPQRIVAQSGAWADEHPDHEVLVAPVIGPSARLVELVLERWAELGGEPIRMNCDTCMYRVLMPGFEAKLGMPQTPHDHPDDPTHDHSHGHAHHHH